MNKIGSNIGDVDAPHPVERVSGRFNRWRGTSGIELRSNRNIAGVVEGTISMPRLGLVDWRRSDDFAPLVLVMSGQEKSRLVRSLGEVAKALVVAWPTDDGEEYMAAVKTCLDVI